MSSLFTATKAHDKARPYRSEGRRLTSSRSGDSIREQLPGMIRRLRERRRFTQEQLALASGLSREFISRIESGRFSMTLETLGALADALSVRPADLLSAD